MIYISLFQKKKKKTRLSYKKLNFYQTLPDFDCLLNSELIYKFNKKNDENVRNNL